MTRWLRRFALVAGLALPEGGASAALAQGSLAGAAERVRQAWLAHDAQAVVGQSARVMLQIPGADLSSAVDRAQVVELLRRHLRPAAERALTIAALREVEPGRGYAELDRRYVVVGTSDVRREMLFLGFRRAGAEWLLAELRSAP